MQRTPAFISALPVIQQRQPRRSISAVRMSGVNGGIDYEIDLATLPKPLAARVKYIQGGPDSPTELIFAAEQLASAVPENPQILPVLVDMLGFNNPVAANIAIDALASAGTESLPSLLRGVAAFNYSVNAYALRAIAKIGDPSVADVCIACAEKGPIPNVRRAACRALSALMYASSAEAEKAYTVLVQLADVEPDWGVRYAAIVALERFMAEKFVNDALLQSGLKVVRAACEGLPKADGEKTSASEQGEVLLEPTVAARAYVALEVMEQRMALMRQ